MPTDRIIYESPNGNINAVEYGYYCAWCNKDIPKDQPIGRPKKVEE